VGNGLKGEGLTRRERRERERRREKGREKRDNTEAIAAEDENVTLLYKCKMFPGSKLKKKPKHHLTYKYQVFMQLCEYAYYLHF
jgi:hypothetical protein